MNKATLLKLNQIYGENRLEIIRQYGAQSIITDFSILLDGFVLNNYHSNYGFTLENRTGMWFTNTFYNGDSVYVVDHRGCKNIISNLKRQCGVRPVLLLLNRSNSSLIREVYYGEYPQGIVDEFKSENLEIQYSFGNYEETGKNYILDSHHNWDSNAKYMERFFKEYLIGEKKYIRFETGDDNNVNILSDGRKIYNNDIYWLDVEPITWIVDYKNGIALSKKILFAGMQFNNYDKSNNYQEESDIIQYLNNTFINNIIPSERKEKVLVKRYN